MRVAQAARVGALTLGICAVALVTWVGIAAAVSGGGYNPAQQDCSGTADNSAAPSNPAATQPGCHNAALDVQSGGTTNGDASSSNPRYVEWGNDQSPHMDKNPGFGGLAQVGDPGTPASPHSGCLSANTAGTGGGTGTGCGNNPAGTGVAATYDYYQLYCPATKAVPVPADPTPATPLGSLPWLYPCASDQPIGQTNLNPDTGPGNSLDTVLTRGLVAYFGMDDNADNGEHDGFNGAGSTDGAINGPSDGGGVTLSVLAPASIPGYLAALAGGPSWTQPEGVANGSAGFCADGICAEGTTQQQTVYYGCGAGTGNNPASDQCAPGTPQNADVYQNSAPASTKQSPNCQSGSADNSGAACFTNADGSPNPNGANGYRQATPQQMNAEPGVQTYQDPDPQRSPVAPFGMPGVYAGTCGVYLNDGGGSVGPGITGQHPGYLGPSHC